MTARRPIPKYSKRSSKNCRKSCKSAPRRRARSSRVSRRRNSSRRHRQRDNAELGSEDTGARPWRALSIPKRQQSEELPNDAQPEQLRTRPKVGSPRLGEHIERTVAEIGEAQSRAE